MMIQAPSCRETALRFRQFSRFQPSTSQLLGNIFNNQQTAFQASNKSSFYSTTTSCFRSSGGHQIKVNPNSSCPFEVLNLPRNSNLETVKRSFLKAALVYHPDKKTGDSAIFVRIREAFEEISLPKRKDGVRGWTTEAEFDEWFQEEVSASDFANFRIDEETRKEIIEVHTSMVKSGKDGYWEMARQLAERDEVSKRIRSENGDPVRALLSAGTEESRSNLRRRRWR